MPLLEVPFNEQETHSQISHPDLWPSSLPYLRLHMGARLPCWVLLGRTRSLFDMRSLSHGNGPIRGQRSTNIEGLCAAAFRGGNSMKAAQFIWNTPAKWKLIRAAASRRAHGTLARYVSGCRCFPCRLANSEWSKEHPAHGCGRTVATDEARAHILALAKLGMGYKSISEASGVNHNIVWRIRQGTHPRARRSTVQRILAVDLSCAKGGTRIDIRPSRKILMDLIARGYSKRQLALWLGYKHAALQILESSTITAANAVRVQRMAALLNAGKLRRGEPSPLAPVKPRGGPRLKGRPGRRSTGPRCPCGMMTLRCAKSRSHHCKGPVAAEEDVQLIRAATSEQSKTKERPNLAAPGRGRL